MTALAIVIPAYKPDFFRAALESVAAQTDPRFRLYIGDDAAPAAIAEITSGLPRGLDVVYHRFEENLGGTSLVAHWNRCVALSSEPWVWLFADDDVMAPDCVAAFHAERDGLDADVVRFDTDMIDAEGRRVRSNPPHPPVERGADFVFARLSGVRHSYVVEHVFRRAAFDRAGGFPDYPAAWCADDAAWFLFARERPIRTLSGGRVFWRASGRNISTSRGRRAEKLEASASFLRFVRSEVMPSDQGGPVRTEEDWLRASERWYLDQLRYPVPVGPALWPEVLRTSRRFWRVGPARKVATLSLWNIRAKYRALRRA